MTLDRLSEFFTDFLNFFDKLRFFFRRLGAFRNILEYRSDIFTTLNFFFLAFQMLYDTSVTW